MDFLELETLKETREYKAAEALADAVNSMGWKPEKFAMGMTVQHRTLQQEVMRTFVAMIHVMASDNMVLTYGTREVTKQPRKWLSRTSSTKSICPSSDVPGMYLYRNRYRTLEPTDERE